MPDPKEGVLQLAVVTASPLVLNAPSAPHCSAKGPPEYPVRARAKHVWPVVTPSQSYVRPRLRGRPKVQS